LLRDSGRLKKMRFRVLRPRRISSIPCAIRRALRREERRDHSRPKLYSRRAKGSRSRDAVQAVASRHCVG
jgi:hypothetical protein